MSHIPFILRETTSNDTNFIFNSFLRSFHAAYPNKYVPDALFYKPQSRIITYLLDTADCLIACYPEAPEQIIGWILSQPRSEATVIHYLYIKNQYRKQGIAKDILSQVLNGNSLVIASHLCDDFGIMRKKVPGAKVIYDPFLINKLMEINVSR